MPSLRPAPTFHLLQRLRVHQRPRHGSRHFSSTASRPFDFYDVVCIGGGPAGLTLVNSLRTSPETDRLKIALVDSQPLEPSRGTSPTEYSNRCSSLTPASVNYLQEIGAWSHIDLTRIQPFNAMHVWDGVSGTSIQFDWSSASGLAAHTTGDQTIAYMTENSNLTTALLARTHQLGGVTIFDKTRVDAIQLGQKGSSPTDLDLRSWPMVQLSNGTTLAARLLVGADGFNSPVRTFADIRSRGWDYERHAVVATLRLDETELTSSSATDRIAYQRFLPTGPAALLPLPGPYATLVWSTLPQHAAHLKSLAPPDFLAMVNAAFRLSPVDLAYLHGIPSTQHDEVSWREQHTPSDRHLNPPHVVAVQPGSVASFPLRLRHADTYTGERVALVGDAAHTVHPLAGQGLNQGIGDVRCLARAIGTAAAQTGEDIGSTFALQPYNADRWAANHVLLGAVDKLHKVYATQAAPVVWARSLGLGLVNDLAPLKHFFMARAAGVR